MAPPLPHQVRVFNLKNGEDSQHRLYRLKKGWSIRFALGPSLMGFPVRLFCNHPANQSVTYDRKTYYELEWKYALDPSDRYAELKMHTAGSFNFFYTIDTTDRASHRNGAGYFLVDPVLQLGPLHEEVELDGIVCQTVITKLLGPFEEWLPRLQVAAESGYNMIHYTPIQELGISNSAYSLRNQLVLSPVYSPGEKKYTLEDVKELMKHLNHKLGLMSLSDLVYNHTAKDSPWVWEHPECTFNMVNSPHLRPAYVMDRIFEHFSLEVGQGVWEKHGIPINVHAEHHLDRIHEVLHRDVFPKFKLQDFYCVDADEMVKTFQKAIESNAQCAEGTVENLTIIQDPQFRRLKSTVDINIALRLYNNSFFSGPEAFRDAVNSLNVRKAHEIQDHINAAIDNFVANARWRFVTPEGPKIAAVIPDEPLMFGYFVIPKAHEGSVEKEEEMSLKEGQNVMAVNGWVMGDDPLRNFAAPGRTVYIRRELMAWGDSVKLNYGEKREDCPFLWDHMAEYTRMNAEIFQGLRLDNCHSTPIHVAEYMLDIARKVRPDLYVIAELFTGSEDIDNLFMNRLGINSLIRESLIAHDSHEEGRLVHRFGGDPVGAFIQPRVKPLVSSMAHALFFDQTHDNECPIHKRTAYDIFPSGALVAVSNCAIGSNRGYDELVPLHISVVTEERLYPSWTDTASNDGSSVNISNGIIAGKRCLNKLHYSLAKQGFSQVYVDQIDFNTVSVTRHNPMTHESVVTVARTVFHHPDNPDHQGDIHSIKVEGSIVKVILEGKTNRNPQATYERNSKFLNGLNEYNLELKEDFPVSESEMVSTQSLDNGDTEIYFRNLTPGSVIVFKCELSEVAKGAITQVRKGLSQFGYLMRSYSGHSMFDETHDRSNFQTIISKLTLADLNRCLFRINQEEQDDGYGFGVYSIPGMGEMIYCGLRGVMSTLAHIRPNNDLGHPLCNNLREGDWLADYIANRLKVHKSLEDLGKWFEFMFGHLKKLPRYLVPCYFDAIVTGSYMVLLETVYDLMSEQDPTNFVYKGSHFVKALSLTSLQMVGYVPQATLPRLSAALKPQPRTEWNNRTKSVEQAPLSISAGFPHFGAGYMRNWGRDTFISIRGLLLVTGRHEEARHIILSYAGTLRHGLIPNLLNEGKGARFNCRDATWFWLVAIREYCTLVPNGYSILEDPVSRMYPEDNSDPEMFTSGDTDQPLHQVMQEALNKHATGLKFRERNAGFQIDDQMTDMGFNNEIGIDWNTGFVFGGNQWNCGTWMDKMGSSERAGNKGKPATPRDGSAVELVGLSAGTALWLSEAHGRKQYPYDGVVDGKTKKKITFKEWYLKIKENFEKHFYISSIANPETDSKLINRRNIYKDSVNSSQGFADFQLRCNFPIAMVACPQLFTPEHAWGALENAGQILLGPLGMKTLDPSDWAYRGNYDNSNDSTDISVARGWNYHQGPEWVWPVGYFLRAKLHFARELDSKKPGLLKSTKLYINTVLSKHYEEIMASPWQGLPELTNSNGQYCAGSCRTQAWSGATLLEVLHDVAMEK